MKEIFNENASEYLLDVAKTVFIGKRDLFRLCPLSLVGAYYLHPLDAQIFE